MTLNNLTSIKLDKKCSYEKEKKRLYRNTYIMIKQGNDHLFKHKIIQEFYVAQYLYRNLTNDVYIHNLKNSKINQNINLSFKNYQGALNILTEHIRQSEDIKEKLIIRTSSNCIYLASILNLNFERQDLQNINLSNTIICNINFFNCNLDQSKFNNVIIKNCNFDFAQLNNIQWDNIQIKEFVYLQQNEDIEQCIIGENMGLLNFLNYQGDLKQIQQLITLSFSLNIKQLQIYSNMDLNQLTILIENNIKEGAVGTLNFSPNSEIVGLIDSYGLRYWNCVQNSEVNSYLLRKENIIQNSSTSIYLSNLIAFEKNNNYLYLKEKIEGDYFVVSFNGEDLSVSYLTEVAFYKWNQNKLQINYKFDFQQKIWQILSYRQNQTICLLIQNDVTLWNIQDNCFKSLFRGCEESKYSINIDENILIKWNEKKRYCQVYNLNIINSNKFNDIFNSYVQKAEFSPSGQLIRIQLAQKILFWDFTNDECYDMLNEQIDFYFSPKGNYFLTKCNQNGLIIWDCTNIYNLERKIIIQNIDKFQKIFFTQENQDLAIINNNGGIIKIWKLQQILNQNFDYDNNKYINYQKIKKKQFVLLFLQLNINQVLLEIP
ncbi:unnamed protein product [Paramecium sonneborni]|uniref:WD40-repeat-containing domain n=1 Tax=Paramecium sonneborni TaxID=65129 RepID=A0A8S1RT68_9CILI|nr:unnamed protein product [Paramecium sonneborni]